jgi:AcrR family transcriptional regulator
VNDVHSQTGTGTLWFTPAEGENSRRRLTRDRVVAALTIISTDGAAALSMRTLATRLGVVPAALYRHVRSRPSRFPALAARGAYAWADDRDQRFTAGLEALIGGLQAAQVTEPRPG